MRICLNCGTVFEENSVTQKYCCSKCRLEYLKNHDIKSMYTVREFECSRCGKHVVTSTERTDKRTKFCSSECERAFWKNSNKKKKEVRYDE